MGSVESWYGVQGLSGTSVRYNPMMPTTKSTLTYQLVDMETATTGTCM